MVTTVGPWASFESGMHFKHKGFERKTLYVCVYTQQDAHLFHCCYIITTSLIKASFQQSIAV